MTRLCSGATGYQGYLFQLHRPWPKPDSTRTHLTFEPLAFLRRQFIWRRLAALVPSPYQNLIRYHGVFANRSHLRPHLPAPPESPKSSITSASPAARPRWHLPGCLKTSSPSRTPSSQATTSRTLTAARHNQKIRSVPAAALRN
ncbi:transposase [Myxococcota bacterium]|nr:transposase [Myxococcota bacterium]MBU1512360.1 transposase [Myxococcota bacterium]